jgi:hypothetical protein
VGVLDAFLSTWSNARATFGEGTPQPGAQFDNSGPLRQMQAIVHSAAPGSMWTGGAAHAYDTANADHAEVFGKIANLDQRLSAKVDQSAQVVDCGRRNLDAVRQWVLGAAAAVPPGKNREQLLMPIVQSGLSRLTEIVGKSNGDLNKIGGEIAGLRGEYDALGKQRFAVQNGESGTGNLRKPLIQAVDYRESPPPEEPPAPEPGGGYGSYHYGYKFSTSEAWSQQEIMKEIQDNYNNYFTFTGDQPKIVEGAVINLNGPVGPEPVKVTKVTDTSFSFISMPGHHEGAGRVIEFSVVPAAASPVPGRLNWELRVEASGPVSGLSAIPGAGLFNKGVWQVFADNLSSQLPISPPSSGGVTV